MQKATINPKEIPVVHSIRNDVGREFLTIDVPEGWDDVKKICKKVLTFDGRKFTFSGWNSDTNQCFFYRVLGDNVRQVATIN
jgi:hypothetical protein